MLSKENNDDNQLHCAIESYNSAIALMSIDEQPWDFANIHQCLGDALTIVGDQHNDVDTYQSAIKSFKQSQLVKTEKDHPEQWAELQGKIDHISSESL